MKTQFNIFALLTFAYLSSIGGMLYQLIGTSPKCDKTIYTGWDILWIYCFMLSLVVLGYLSKIKIIDNENN